MRKTAHFLVALALIVSAGIFHQTRPPREHTQQAAASFSPTDAAPIPEDHRSEAEKRAHAEKLNAEASRALRFDQRNPKLQNDPLDRSQLSDEALLLDDPQLGDGQAMAALHSLFTSLRSTAFRGDYPVGLNVEMTNALLGANPIKVGVIPIDCPRINENGELIDAHGTPYWFHSQGSADLTITSAGPDRLLHTADDLIYPEPDP